MNNYSKWEDFLHADLNEWHNTIMGEIFTHRQEKNRPELPLLSVTGEDGVVDRDTLERRDTSNADKSKYLRVAPGDIVYNTMRMWQGVSGSAPKDGLVSPAYTVLEPKKSITSAFAKYLVKEERLVQVFHKNSQGLVDDTLNLKFANFSPIQVKIPPLPEQKKIASILTSVDEVIEKTQSQIKKLKDLKKGTMNELLTKGIGHTEFKDSELGRIPMSWEIKRIGDVASLIMGQSPSSDTYNQNKNGMPFFQGKADFGVKHPTIRYWCTSPTKVAPVDSILFSVRAPVGDVNFNNVKACIGRGLASILGTSVDNTFLYQSLIYAKGKIKALGQGSTFEAINSKELKELPLACPPLQEQKRMVSIFNSIDNQIDHKKQKLSQTQSLKKSLMQDLLTGKVRVTVN